MSKKYYPIEDAVNNVSQKFKLGLKDANEMDTPEDIDPIFATAIAENLDWICLDSDGPIDNGFKIYEWED